MNVRLPDAVMYHYVRAADAQPPVGYRGLDPATLEAQLDDVCRVATPVGWPAIAAALAGGAALPPDAVVLTFDDGLVDHVRVVLPALVARRLPAIFFVLARDPDDGLALGHRIHVLTGVRSAANVRVAIVERLADPDRATFLAMEDGLRRRGLSDPDDLWKRPLQRDLAAVANPILAELVAAWLGPEADVARALYLGAADRAALLDAGMALGGHGFDHAWMDALPAAARHDELARSAALLATYGGGPWPFAYPYGGVPADAAAELEDHGFAAAFTTRPGVRPDAFHIGRHDADELGPGGLAAALTAARRDP